MTLDAELLAQSYEAAADYIDAHGWHQGNLVRGLVQTEHDSITLEDYYQYISEIHPPVCAMGAGYAVGVGGCQLTNPIDLPFSAVPIFDWLNTLEVELGNQSLPGWNDSAHRTQEEVVDLLRLTASKIRMGNIGDNPREYEFEPFPESEPMVEPAAPQPAPAEPEKVPA